MTNSNLNDLHRKPWIRREERVSQRPEYITYKNIEARGEYQPHSTPKVNS